MEVDFYTIVVYQSVEQFIVNEPIHLLLDDKMTLDDDMNWLFAPSACPFSVILKAYLQAHSPQAIHAKNAFAVSLLIQSAQRGLTESVDLLLSKDASLNDTTPYRHTALILASHHGHLDTVAYLIGQETGIHTLLLGWESIRFVGHLFLYKTLREHDRFIHCDASFGPVVEAEIKDHNQ